MKSKHSTNFQNIESSTALTTYRFFLLFCEFTPFRKRQLIEKIKSLFNVSKENFEHRILAYSGYHWFSVQAKFLENCHFRYTNRRMYIRKGGGGEGLVFWKNCKSCIYWSMKRNQFFCALTLTEVAPWYSTTYSLNMLYDGGKQGRTRC